MKKSFIRGLIAALIAMSAWFAHAETADENSGKAAEVPAAEIQPAAAPAALSPEPAKVTFEKFESPEGKFSVSIPAGWSQTESFPYGIDDTVNGVMLEGPKNPEGAPMTMAVLHYAGTGSIEGAQDYMRRVLSSPTRTDAEQETKFTDIEVAGIKGTTFTFKKFHLVVLPFRAPPMKDGVMYEMKPPTRTVGMIVRYIVIPAKPGFYSFMYEAPEDIYEQYAGVFDEVVKSFALGEKQQ